MTTLITGIGGGLAQRVAERLLDAGEEAVGVDYRDVTERSTRLDRLVVHRARSGAPVSRLGLSHGHFLVSVIGPLRRASMIAGSPQRR